MTAFDTAVEQKSEPVYQLLDALFARVQADQKIVQRQYMAITELRGSAGRLMRDGAEVALHLDGDDLVLRVTVPGLDGLTGARPLGGDLVVDLDKIMPAFLRPWRAFPVAPVSIEPAAGFWAGFSGFESSTKGPERDESPPAVIPAADPLAELIAAQEAVEPVVAPASEPAFKSHWSDAEDDELIEAALVNMRAGMRHGQAVSAASEAMGRTARAGLERMRRFLQDRLDAKLAAEPIAASGHIAAALVSDGRGQHGSWPDMWSAEDQARLVGLVATGVCAGKSKSLALADAATVMGRSKKACENRIYNRLASDLQAEIDRLRGPDAPPLATIRKVASGKITGWTPEDDARLVQIVADAICEGQPKWVGIEAASKALGRPEQGVQFRILNKAKDDLAAELARRAAGVTPDHAAAAPAAAKIVLPPASPPEAVPVVRDGGAPPSAPVAPLPSPALLPVVDGSTGLRLNEAAIADAPPAPPRAPKPAIVADACPPRPAAGERVSQVAPPDDLAPVLAHLRALTKGDAKVLKADFAILHLACAGWGMGDIATDLGMDSKAVSQRFKALCGYEGGKGRFLRSHVYEAIQHLLTPAAVVA